MRNSLSTSTEEWTEDRVAKLRALYNDGLSSSKIAETLGGVSRNAVIGKITRLGLNGYVASPRPRTLSGAAKTNRRRPIMQQGGGFASLRGGKPKEPTLFHEDDFPVETRKTFIELRFATKDHPGDCRWPGAEGYFCGVPAVDGRSFCYAHCCRAYTNFSNQESIP